jgi:adenosylmethionine-8-amino-7-oxononanoate aminotransferase
MEIAPKGFDHIFLAGSGSEAVDTALKMALAYHRARGEGHRQRLIGRQRSYHGMGFGGLSVSGIGWQRAQFGVIRPCCCMYADGGIHRERGDARGRVEPPRHRAAAMRNWFR